MAPCLAQASRFADSERCTAAFALRCCSSRGSADSDKTSASLEASTQAGQHIAGRVVLTAAYLLCPCAVDIDCPVEQIEGLLDSQVGRAWNVTDLLHHVLGQIVVLLERQLPRKIRIIAAVRQAAMIASRTMPRIAARTKID
jgi:hypothetical protein